MTKNARGGSAPWTPTPTPEAGEEVSPPSLAQLAIEVEALGKAVASIFAEYTEANARQQEIAERLRVAKFELGKAKRALDVASASVGNG